MIVIESEIKPILFEIGKTKNIFTIQNEDEKKSLSYLNLKSLIGAHIGVAVPVIEIIDGVEVKNMKQVGVKINAFQTEEEIKEDIINQVKEKLNGSNN